MQRSTTMFTKCPRPERVKTRLSPDLSPEQAAQLAEAMLLDTAEVLGDRPDLGPALAFAEREDAGWFRQALSALPSQAPQGPGGLGQRLARHFERALGLGTPAEQRPRTAVVLGSDQPLVPPARFAEAHAALEAGADLVLGPDPGGGYYLVGLRRPLPQLFTEVRMSSDGMCSATVALAKRLGATVELLPVELDVDTPSDLRALWAAVGSDPVRASVRAPRTVEWLRDLSLSTDLLAPSPDTSRPAATETPPR